MISVTASSVCKYRVKYHFAHHVCTFTILQSNTDSEFSFHMFDDKLVASIFPWKRMVLINDNNNYYSIVNVHLKQCFETKTTNKTDIHIYFDTINFSLVSLLVMMDWHHIKDNIWEKGIVHVCVWEKYEKYTRWQISNINLPKLF